jgi:ABC-2 type transport system ATP-binding protein
MISVEAISKRYGELRAVDGLSFDVRRGEVVGFLGPNGAGKSTTMKILTGALQPDEGRVLFDGAPIADDLPAAKRRIGYLPENNALYPDLLVSEYLDYAYRLRELPAGGRARALARVVEQTEVGSVFTRPIAQLSKGFRQRVGLAAAILHEPEILVLDEPTEGLDPNQRVGIRTLISEIGRDRTVILSTHVLGEVEATCTRLLIINRGRLAADGAPADLLDAQRAAARYLVEAAGTGVAEGLQGLPGVADVRTEAVEGRVRAQRGGEPRTSVRGAALARRRGGAGRGGGLAGRARRGRGGGGRHAGRRRRRSRRRR